MRFGIQRRFGYVGRVAPFLLLLFLLVPLAEIWFLIVVGGWIGALPTVLLVVATAVLGAALARYQGFATLRRLQATLDRGEMPALEMLEGVLLLVGAVLLLTPGFFTDLAGFACLLPVTRHWLARQGLQHIHFPSGPRGGPAGPGARIIEGEFRREDEDP